MNKKKIIIKELFVRLNPENMPIWFHYIEKLVNVAEAHERREQRELKAFRISVGLCS